MFLFIVVFNILSHHEPGAGPPTNSLRRVDTRYGSGFAVLRTKIFLFLSISSCLCTDLVYVYFKTISPSLSSYIVSFPQTVPLLQIPCHSELSPAFPLSVESCFAGSYSESMGSEFAAFRIRSYHQCQCRECERARAEGQVVRMLQHLHPSGTPLCDATSASGKHIRLCLHHVHQVLPQESRGELG